MITPNYCQTMARYNAWMNERLYEACATLPDRERKRDQGLFFRSIHGTLNHLLYGDRAWMARFQQRPLDVSSPGEELHSDFEALWAERRSWDARINDWASAVEPEWLRAGFRYTSQVDGLQRSRPAGLLVAHLFNHQTHHRGQLTAALSQCGVDYGVTDLPFMESS